MLKEKFLVSKDEMKKSLFMNDFEIDKFINDENIKQYSIGKENFLNTKDINNLIKNNKKVYDFTKINLENPPQPFIEKRGIKKNGYNVIDLFCGAGGSSAGFELAGFNIVGALDFNEKAVLTHKLNYPDCKTIQKDITELTPKEFSRILENDKIDVIIGSPPCQTFSSLSQGKIKSLGKDIKEDIRNYYYKNFLDYIFYFKPKMFLMENVPGFRTRFNGKIFENFLGYIKKNLPEYSVKYEVLDSINYGVPQSRKRLFVCGYLKDIKFEFPKNDISLIQEGNSFVSVGEAFYDLPNIIDDWRLDKLPYKTNENLTKFQNFIRNREGFVLNNICRISNNAAKNMFKYLKPGQKYIDLEESYKEKINLFNTFNSSVIQSRCRRLPLNQASWTIIAHIGMDGYEYIHPLECRTISVREAARLQSFPDDFVFIGNMREQYVQIGNAVPPLFSYALAKQILKSLE